MSAMPDARVPVRFARLGEGTAESAWLVQDDLLAPEGVPVARFSLPSFFLDHPPGCACCVPRGPVARAFSNMFLARVHGEMAYFRDVRVMVLDAAGEAAVRDALANDPVLLARFRLIEA